MTLDNAEVAEEAARLRARHRVYLARRSALLEEHCPIIPPLRALVSGYEGPTTTDELWATNIECICARGTPPPLRSHTPEVQMLFAALINLDNYKIKLILILSSAAMKLSSFHDNSGFDPAAMHGTTNSSRSHIRI
jgi:hypothetical protein